ncbi:MAG: NAD(P)H-dependent glycerol-3-phosphate dehydrogenase [Thermoleophilia bacterium]
MPSASGDIRAAVVGAGSWGTVFAVHLATQGARTVLLARRREQAEEMAHTLRNPDYVTFLELPASLGFSTMDEGDLSQTDLVVLAVPSRAFAETVRALSPRLRDGVGLLSLTKGIDPNTLDRLSQVLERETAALQPRVAVLSGPNHAEEVALNQPTATVIASHDDAFAADLQDLLSSDYFRPYRSKDVVGVELAAAVKNVIALATGMADGLGYGDNVRAALITRGLAEMARLGEAFGASPMTFAGLAGMGDLIATCTSRHSRNRRAGELIAQGYSPEDVEKELGMVAEGLTAAPAVLELARRKGVEMPITENVVAVIFEGKDLSASVRDLMGRPARAERH